MSADDFSHLATTVDSADVLAVRQTLKIICESAQFAANGTDGRMKMSAEPEDSSAAIAKKPPALEAFSKLTNATTVMQVFVNKDAAVIVYQDDNPGRQSFSWNGILWEADLDRVGLWVRSKYTESFGVTLRSSSGEFGKLVESDRDWIKFSPTDKNGEVTVPYNFSTAPSRATFTYGDVTTSGYSMLILRLRER